MKELVFALDCKEQTSIYGGETKELEWSNEKKKEAETYYYIWTNN